MKLIYKKHGILSDRISCFCFVTDCTMKSLGLTMTDVIRKIDGFTHAFEHTVRQYV
ncbi:hypothetical protein LCTS_04060 [Leuconostoc citreum]|nr:hypothetical protein LCTS_04060 [Leuconostoc citreum]